MMFRVTSLKQLSSAEFNDEKVKIRSMETALIMLLVYCLIWYKISSIFLPVVNLGIQRNLDFNEFVQNFLCCDKGMKLKVWFIPQCQFCLPKEIKSNLDMFTNK